jgi:hypothetical protein
LEYLGLHNKPKAEVHPGHKMTGPKEEEEEKKKRRRKMKRRRRKKKKKKRRKKKKRKKKKTFVIPRKLLDEVREAAIRI